MSNFILSKKLSTTESADILLVHIDGQKQDTLETFYAFIAEQLHFPDYFSQNLDSFDELINDLSWLEQEAVIFLIEHFDEWLEEENLETKELMLSILDQAADEQKADKDGTAIKIMIKNTGDVADFLDTIGVEYLEM